MCIFQICHQSHDSSSFVLTSANFYFYFTTHHLSRRPVVAAVFLVFVSYFSHTFNGYLFFSPKFLIENQSTNYAALFYEWPQPKQKKKVTKYRILFSLLTNKNRDTINKLLCIIKSVSGEFSLTEKMENPIKNVCA